MGLSFPWKRFHSLAKKHNKFRKTFIVDPPYINPLNLFNGSKYYAYLLNKVGSLSERSPACVFDVTAFGGSYFNFIFKSTQLETKPTQKTRVSNTHARDRWVKLKDNTM